jgi:hypothetical protein
MTRSGIWWLLPATCVVGLAVACSGGKGGGNSPTPTPSPTPTIAFTIAVDSSAVTLDFDQTATVAFHVTPVAGFTGNVTISLVTASNGLHSAGTSVNVSSSAPVAGTIDVDTKDLANVVPGRYSSLTVHAASGAAVADAATILTVRPHLIRSLRAGVLNQVVADFWGPAPAAGGLVLHMGTDTAGQANTTFTIGWTNDDAVAHELHTAGYDGFGFTHAGAGDPGAQPGGTQSRDVKPLLSSGTPSRSFLPANFYCHSHGAAVQPGELTFVQ